MILEDAKFQEYEDRVVQLGAEATKFVHSTLGKRVIERADAMIDDHVQLLVSCEPDDIRGNTKHRNMIQVGELFKEWLLEAIDDADVIVGQRS